MNSYSNSYNIDYFNEILKVKYDIIEKEYQSIIQDANRCLKSLSKEEGSVSRKNKEIKRFLNHEKGVFLRAEYNATMNKLNDYKENGIDSKKKLELEEDMEEIQSHGHQITGKYLAMEQFESNLKLEHILKSKAECSNQVTSLQYNQETLKNQYNRLKLTSSLIEYIDKNSDRFSSSANEDLTNILLDTLEGLVDKYSVARKEIDNLMQKPQVNPKDKQVQYKPEIKTEEVVLESCSNEQGINSSLSNYGYNEKQIKKLVSKIGYKQLNQRVGVINDVLSSRHIPLEGYKHLNIPTAILTKSDKSYEVHINNLKQEINRCFPNN